MEPHRVKPQDVGELEIAQSKAIRADGGRKDWEAEAEERFRFHRDGRFGCVRE